MLDMMFWENLELKEAHSLKDLLSRVYHYINYKEKLLSMGINRVSGNMWPSQPPERDVGQHKEEGEWGTQSIFDAYTPLNTSREKILK